MGRLLDSVYRPLGLGAMLAVQDLCILLSCGALAVAARTGAPLASTPLFPLMVGLAMLEKLSSISSELAIERDWVTQLAGGWAPRRRAWGCAGVSGAASVLDEQSGRDGSSRTSRLG